MARDVINHWFCDRCGRIVTSDYVNAKGLNQDRLAGWVAAKFDGQDIDICDECAPSFYGWFSGVAVEG
jgi:hypothetical protein